MMNKNPSRAALASILLAAAACISACASRSAAPTLYDLGPLYGGAPGAMPAVAPGALPPLSMAEVSAPAWLDSPLMFFRLSYANDQQPRPYAASRWTMAPAQLFGQRLKARLAQGGGVVLAAADGAANLALLRIEADDFTQSFDSPVHSSVQIALRASVFNGRTLLAQKTFVKQVPAPSADAAGGARALANASDTLITDMTAWLAGLPLKK